ncbi:MmgE/PrpD family protein [Bradyrhizobium brasilense]|uniref:MmgE/PrpD family protein n=1 Tax=Bradyrhizobium brasilense TaxID=1419277 RepID=UPI001E2E87DA|nr:MmgE/PrpD family protein [Bradyrhizobium brasilense]MCC8969630.1 MmgE/PrpD family protein [Bradyrhizobium brasilense]
MTVLETLANWCHDRDAVWTETALSRAEHAIADTIACIVAGSQDAVSKRVIGSLLGWDGVGTSTVIGTSRCSAAPWAALINGTAAHVLEIDDNYYPGLTHASAILVPALLAVAEEIDASGASLVDAYIVGLELHAALGRGVNRSHYFAGWHPTATVGCIGTAGACARLMGLSREATLHAMSLATSMAAGNKAQFGTQAKSVQCGLGAQHAVMAARLGAAGVQGNPAVLEHPQGFLALYGGPDPRGWEMPLRILDNPLAIEEFGLAPKRHACCGSAHNTLDCILDLRAQHPFNADEVRSIEVLIGASNRRNLQYDNPEDAFQARFSMHYNVALILLYGRVSVSDFTDEAVRRPEVRALLDLTHISARRFDDEPKDPDIRLPHLVKLTLKDGRVLRTERAYARGLLQDPFTDAERADKIADCCRPVLPGNRLPALFDQLRSVRTVAKVRSLMDLLAFRSDRRI